MLILARLGKLGRRYWDHGLDNFVEVGLVDVGVPCYSTSPIWSCYGLHLSSEALEHVLLLMISTGGVV